MKTSQAVAGIAAGIAVGAAAATAVHRRSQRRERVAAAARSTALAARASVSEPPTTPVAAGIETVLLTTIDRLEPVRPPVPNRHHSDRAATETTRMSDESDTAMSGYNKLISHDECVLGDIIRKPGSLTSARGFVRAGPRAQIHFEPSQVTACIVTCGGLCPGLNNVIREVCLSLHNLYGVKRLYAIRGGFGGFWRPDAEPPYVLVPSDAQASVSGSGPVAIINGTPRRCERKSVQSIHHLGGTFIGAGRGGFDEDKLLEFVRDNDVSQVYVVGGDGTQRGALKLSEAVRAAGLDCAVAGVPKTIDNDLAFVDRSFGFNTAVEAARAAVQTAKIEAMCNKPRGIGIVKLMGRSAGFIAAHATLSSGDVDLCLVPEVDVVLRDGDGAPGGRAAVGCLHHIQRCVERNGHAVVVVAEGAGEELLGQSVAADAGGNRKLPKIGAFLKDEIASFFEEQGTPATIKYIDPSYMVRSGPANAGDAVLCMILAQNAVHGAMAGYTGFLTGLVNNRVVYLPMAAVCANSPRAMNATGRTWERVIALTRQPNTVKAGGRGGDRASSVGSASSHVESLMP